MAVGKMQGAEGLFKLVEAAAPDVLRELVEQMVEKLMAAEVDGLCGAEYRARSAERVNARNGYRHRPWDTRLGTIDLAVPKLRAGTYFPNWLLTPRRRSEQALVAVIIEAYVLGVSTRNVEELVQALGIERLSKSPVRAGAAVGCDGAAVPDPVPGGEWVPLCLAGCDVGAVS